MELKNAMNQIEYIDNYREILLMELKQRRFCNPGFQTRIRNAKFVKFQTVDQFNFDRNAITKKHRLNCLSLFDSIGGEDLALPRIS